MNRALIIAAALTLAGASSALAQDHDHGREGGGRPPAPPAGHPAPPQGHPGGGGPPGGRPGGPPPGYAGAPGGGYRGAPGAYQHGQPGAYQGGGRPGYPGGYQGGAGFRGGPGGGYPARDGGFRGGPGGYGYGGGPSGPGFHGGGRFSYRGRSFSSFRAAPFYYPRGFGYRRWGVGAYLPGLFLGDAYFIGDWGSYNLGPPPYGEHWVRYGPDALLVNNYTGQIDDVVYGVFYW